MIEIQCFNEAYQHYKEHKISLRLFQDQAAVMLGLCQNSHPSVSNPLEVTLADIDWLMQQPEAMKNYAEFLGGAVYICETVDDLLQIHGCDFKWAKAHDWKWPNVTDIALSWDVCEYLPEINIEPQWVMFLMCWNNAGGPVYYVPKCLWTKSRVTEHIEATNSSSTT